MISRELLLFFIAAFLSIVGGYCDLFIKDELSYTNFWMLMNSLAWFFLALALWFSMREKQERIYVMGGVILCFSEVLDELIFSPNALGWNDFIFLILAVSYIAVNTKK